MAAQTTKGILLSRNFLLSFASFFFLWVSFDFFIIFPLFIMERGGNSVDIGLQTAIFYLPSVFVRPFAGWLTDRVGRLKVLMSGTVLMICTSLLLLTLTGSYREIRVWMALILFLRGTGFAAFYTAFFTYVADLSTAQNRARIIGLFGISGLVAHGVAPRSAEFVVQLWRFQGFFLATALLAGASLVITLFLTEQERPTIRGQKGLAIFNTVTWSRRNLIAMPGSFMFGYVIASFTTFGAPFFQQFKDMHVGNFFLTYGLVAGGSRLLLGGLADRFPRWKLISIFFLLQGAGVSLIVVSPVQTFALVGAALCGTAHSILFPAMTAMAVDAHGAEYRGVVTSVFTAMMELGFSLGSYALGYVVAGWGYRPMFLAAAAGGAIFSVYTLLAGWRIPAAHSAVPSPAPPVAAPKGIS